ncbi:chromate efflux transporter [Roseibium aggregatum]|uniref:Chromate efflux transporter n=1 Tax=Roseibium aggregatum TaxID=187304 RepID=A0A926P2J0_9HYPH|nr:chromate efflux transporter [Roseibium aggregatum]MBD1548373.1 chromate efflux transporter [Roseibium aggregatum]
MDRTEPPSLTDICRVAFKVGIFSFGGPAAQIAMMHQEFVEKRKWLTEDRYLHALNYCMLLPGPEAQQLATYCGWIAGKTRGGLIAGLLFILPGAFAMALVSFIYARYGKIPAIEAVFYGVKAGVLAIVIQALLKIGRKALKSRLSWALALASFCALFFFAVPFPLVILAAGLIGVWSGAYPLPEASGGHRPAPASIATSFKMLGAGVFLWALPPIAAFFLLAPDHILVDVARFFATLAAVSFGGAYALLSYMAQVAVETKDWLSAGEMLDGLGLAETTPGPLILVTQFVGFLAGYREPAPFTPLTGGLLAAAMTTWTTFAPSFLLVLVGAPWMERLRGNRKLAAALSGITAAVAGTILNLAVWFALNVFFATVSERTVGPLTLAIPDPASLDVVKVMIALVAAGLVFGARRGVVTVISATALLGLAGHFFLG